MSPNTLKTLQNTAKAAFLSCLAAATLNTAGNVSEWAVKKRKLAPNQSFTSKHGAVPYSLDLTPYAKAQMESFTDPEVQTTVLMQAADTGKTETINNCIGFCMSEEPSRILVLYPIEKSAIGWSKEHLAPMIEFTPCLKGVVSEAKSRDSENTILHKIFAGGSISVIAGNSPSNFRLRRVRVAVADEIDALPSSVRTEGDPITLLFKRTEGYEDSIQILSSTPGIKGDSKIENWLEKSDFNEWWVPCQDCGAFQTLKWINFRWPKGKHEECRWHCEKCDHRHTPSERVKAIRQGEWRARNPFNGVRGYWLPGYYSIFPAKKGYKSKEHQMAKDAHDAKHSEDPVQTVKAWTNTFLCETFEEEEEAKPDWKVFSLRREDYGLATIPVGVIRVTGGIDVQLDRLECCLFGHGRNGETWVLHHEIIPGNPKEMNFDQTTNVWNRLEAFLVNAKLKRTDGKLLRIASVGVDTSEPLTKRTTYEFIRPREHGMTRWFGFRGSSLIDDPEVKLPKRSKVDRITLRMVGTNLIKGQIYDRAKIETPGTRYIHLAKNISDQWCEQLFAESSRPIRKNGIRYRQYECPKNTRNEALDCFVYATAALISLGVTNWDYEEKNLKTEDQPTVQQEKAQPIARSGGGFVGGGGGWRI